MSLPSLPKMFRAGTARIGIFPTRLAGGRSAAARAADLIGQAIGRRGVARIILATGNSQLALIEALAESPGLDWSRVEAFHMDEYVGISASHAASFRRWVQDRFANKCHPQAMHLIAGDAQDLPAEISRYGHLLDAAPIDLAFVGFGENGHIAFNDPPVADFNDPVTLKVVTLEDSCRQQQVGEGHFGSLAEVPTQAITITCSGLFRAKNWICCVPEARKAAAVRAALTGPVDTACPASVVRRHPSAFVYLDLESASGITS